MSKSNCYNCGIELTNENSTKEHIPAKNLFAGYDEKYKVNRITVPGCVTCNGGYNLTDEEFRNLIGTIATNKANNEIKKKAERALKRSKSNRERIGYNNLGKVSGITFNNTPIEDYHKKNFKGLYLHEYGKVLSDDYEIHVNIDENDWSDEVKAFLGYLTEMFEIKHSGHPDILKYSIQPFRLGIENPDKKDLELNENEDVIAAYLEYNNEHAALVIAIRKGWLEEQKQKRQQQS